MKRLFRIGQRVRLIKSGCNAPVGATGTITCIAPDRTILDGHDYGVRLDEYQSKSRSGEWSAKETTLEPIWPGSEKTTWAECMWKPVPLGKRKLETA